MTAKISGIIEGTQPEEVMKLLVSLANDWGDELDTNKIQAVHLSGAMTNVVYRVTWPKNATDAEERAVLVRIYGEGSDIFFDRAKEIQTFELISTHGHGPRLFGLFPEGRVEEFIHAKTLSASDLRDPEISTLVAAKLKEFHGFNMPGSKTVVLWSTMRKWLIKAGSLCTQEHANEFKLDVIENEIDTLENELSKHHQDVVFCHNDLQYGNIMIDDNTSTVTLIDYEYASYNPAGYDIANHFCEWAADYHTDTPQVLDYNKYPSLEERQRFVKAYLSATGNQPSDTDVDQLIDDVEKYALANHLFWGLWGIISGYVNQIEFDYMEYARQRFGQYWLKKPQVFNC
ncbi:putative choline kinase 3 [Bidens hawaiensis]|uniref:putative choline kinase 3 n=1 Tax=Bidens hawaiensis TaxID=980011 RepID=UPI004049D561